jgi:hypothetical protein
MSTYMIVDPGILEVLPVVYDAYCRPHIGYASFVCHHSFGGRRRRMILPFSSSLHPH